MSNKCDVLNLEWSSFPSRDRQMASMVSNYLRYMGFSVIEGSVFNGYHLINKYNPKVLFMTNTTGAVINLKLMKYAKARGVKGLSLISEGNFREGDDLISEFVWGVNKDKILYEDINLYWSERTKNLALSYYPYLDGRIKVSGGVGFDAYKNTSYQSKEDFLKKYNKSRFKKVIGFGCWDFGIFYPNDLRYPIIKKYYSKESIERFKRDREELNEILLELIKDNQDILFLLKEHPGTLGGKKASGILGTDHFQNTLILKNEESIGACINVCDFWSVYESTTALEAWLMGKQTCLINPSGIDFPRDRIYMGSPNFASVRDFQTGIDRFYSSGELVESGSYIKIRNDIIKETIQWDDGLNHVRAGNEVIKLIKQEDEVILKKENIKQIINRMEQTIKWYFSPIFRKLPKWKRYYEECRLTFNDDELVEYQNSRYNEQELFYIDNNLSKRELSELECK